MDTAGDVEFAEDFCEVVGGLTGSLARYQWQSRAFDYVKGLLLAGHRKSIEGISEALGLPHCQGLHHFISNASWDASVVMADLARAAEALIGPSWWIVDDTGFRKCGKHSAGVARQYTGTAGDVKNCQIGVSLQLARHEASSPIGWRLFLPESWDPASPKADADIATRRQRAKVPDTARHRTKGELALDLIDAALAQGLSPRPVSADSGYGNDAGFRLGLTDRGLVYAAQIRGDTSVLPESAARTAPAGSGRGRPPTLRYRDQPVSAKDFVMTAGRKPRTVTWRQVDTDDRALRLSSRFLFFRVRPAGKKIRARYADADVPVEWLIAEWPEGKAEPVRYWLSTLPAGTTRQVLVETCKARWRVEHDYREHKQLVGLDEYQMRSWTGWHHHTALASLALFFLTWNKLHPKA